MKTKKITVDVFEDKQQWMKNQLLNAESDYWSRDIWKPLDNPFCEEDTFKLKEGRASIKFDQIKSDNLKIEIKSFYYHQVITGKWKITTLYKDHPYRLMIHLPELLNKYSEINSLLDKSLNEWEIIVTTFLLSKTKLKTRNHKRYCNDGVVNDYTTKDNRIYCFKNIYTYLEDIYDTRDKWEKDIWKDCDFLETDKNHTRGDTINFSLFKQLWLKQVAKSYCRYLLLEKHSTFGTCLHKIEALRNFSYYLEEYYPYIKPKDLNRRLIENYLSYLADKYKNLNRRRNIITHLNVFFTDNELKGWLDISERVIYSHDKPRYTPNTWEEKVIPDFVVQQLLENLSDFPAYQQKMIIILANVGMRISEAIELRFDCLISNGSGGYLIRYYQSKLKKQITKPIASIFHSNEEIIAVIKQQQNIVKGKFTVQCPYLFPSPLSKTFNIRPIAAASFIHNLKKVSTIRNIVDKNGKIWNFHPHQFRHTVGTKLANDDEVGLFGTQTYLGHESVDMTLRYAHMSERKLQRKIEKFNKNNQVIDYTGKSIRLDQDERFKEYWNYIKEGNLLKAQTLEHGLCTLPAMLSPCPHKHKCLSCTHFVTTPEHLPFHANEYKIQLARKKVAEARGQKRVVEDYASTLEQLEKIITKCGGDLETIKASINNQEPTSELNIAQIQQLISKMGLSSIEELKQAIQSIEES